MSMFDAWFIVLRLLIGVSLLWRLRALPVARRAATDATPCAVVVPARDEAGNLGPVLAAVRPQLQPDDELLVIDDHSRDDTADVAAGHGVTVIAAPALPAGWTGKSWACWTGAGATSQPVLCFLDADTVLAPGSLARVVNAVESGGGLVSVQPYHRVPTPVERLSALFNVVALMGTGAFTLLGERVASRAAFGPVLAVRRADYARLGGHRAVASNVLDDVALAHRWRGAGLPVRCFAGRDDVSFRMYPGGLRSLVEGWTKNFATGAGAIRPLVALLTALWVSLPLQALWWLGRLALPGRSVQQVLVAAGLYVVTAGQLWWMLRRVGSFGLMTAALFPLPTIAFAVVFVRSLVQTLGRRTVRWKGRPVAVGRGLGSGPSGEPFPDGPTRSASQGTRSQSADAAAVRSDTPSASPPGAASTTTSASTSTSAPAATSTPGPSAASTSRGRKNRSR